MRLTTIIKGEYHITIPNHKNLKIGTINNILTDISEYLVIEKRDLMKELFR